MEFERFVMSGVVAAFRPREWSMLLSIAAARVFIWRFWRGG